MKKPKRLMFIIMILLTLMSSIAAFASVFLIQGSNLVQADNPVHYSINERVSSGSSFNKDYWVGTNQTISIKIEGDGTTNKPSDITSTVTNLTTGKVVNSDQDYANGIIVYTLDGQNAYFRLRVTNNTNQTLKITGWAEIFTW